MAWNPGGPGNDATGHLLDQFLAALQTKNAGVAMLRGEGPCDMNCVVRRMTTLDESWGTVSRGRSEARDEMLLNALTDVVVPYFAGRRPVRRCRGRPAPARSAAAPGRRGRSPPTRSARAASG